MTDSRLLLIRKEGKILTLLFTGGKLMEVNVWPDNRSEENTLGSIYAARVSHTLSNIRAAFVELEGGQKGFLPLEHLNPKAMQNRVYDGRVLAGDILLVQVEREAVKTKDPVLTTDISLSGRYCVAMPGNNTVSSGCRKYSFSGKLGDERKNSLKKALCEEFEKDPGSTGFCSYIIRTNAGELEEYSPLFREMRTLAEQIQSVMRAAGTRTCGSCLYRPAEEWLTEIRDTAYDQYEKILTEDPILYNELSAYLEQYAPGLLPRLSFYEDDRIGLYQLYGLSSRLKEATESRVWLNSGGYLVIEPTEALTVIDVNSGKYSGRKGAAETFLLINREAALETARQIRLRNLSGIILVDFINMENKTDEKELMEFFRRELKKDPVKTVLVDMTPLGLVEITRKKVKRSLSEQLKVSGGKGGKES